MRNRIIGGIVGLWGAAVIVSGLMKGVGKGAYGAGQMGGLIFGGLLFCVGMYYLIKGNKKKVQ